jgi:hypothetical protein
LDEPADWTLYGIRAVELYFFGHPGNDATELEAMYLKVTDTNDDSGYVVYGSKEPEQLSDMQVEDWELWAVDLAEFAAQSVNLDQVASIAIGFGDPTNCHREPGGAGVMYIDDLALRPKRCIPKYATSIYDTNGDCVVDELDLGQVVEDWLVDQR